MSLHSLQSADTDHGSDAVLVDMEADGVKVLGYSGKMEGWTYVSGP